MFKLNGEHGEVVTLLSIAYELVHGIRPNPFSYHTPLK